MFSRRTHKNAIQIDLCNDVGVSHGGGEGTILIYTTDRVQILIIPHEALMLPLGFTLTRVLLSARNTSVLKSLPFIGNQSI